MNDNTAPSSANTNEPGSATPQQAPAGAAAHPEGNAGGKQQPQPDQARPSASPTMSGAERCFSLLAAVGPLALFIFWLIQSIPALFARPLHGLFNAAGQVQTLFVGLPPTGAAAPAPEAVQPLYALFLDGLAALGGTEALSGTLPAVGRFFAVNRLSGEVAFPFLYQPEFMPLAAALAGLFLLLLTWGLSLAAGYGKRTAFASACVLFIMLALAGLPAFAGQALFSASLITASLLCLYGGWIRPFAPLRLCLGFAFAALATLAAGLVGLVIPLLTSLIFLIWRGTFRRAGALDGAIGFGLMLIILLARAAFLALWSGPEGQEALRLFIDEGFLVPLGLAWEMRGSGWWLLFPMLLLLWLPFPLLVPFLHWERAASLPRAFFKNRAEHPGRGWIWAALASCLATFALLGVGAPLVLLPTLIPLAILTAQGIMGLASGCSRIFFLLQSLVLLILAALFLGGGLYPMLTGEIHPALAAIYAVAAPTQEILYAMLAQGALCLIFALLLWKATNRAFPGGGLLVLTLFALCIALPLTWEPLTAAAPQQILEQAPEQTPEQTPARTEIPATPKEEPVAQPEQNTPEQATPEQAAPEQTAPALPAPVQSDPVQSGQVQATPEKPAPEVAGPQENTQEKSSEQPTPEALPRPAEEETLPGTGQMPQPEAAPAPQNG